MRRCREDGRGFGCAAFCFRRDAAPFTVIIKHPPNRRRAAQKFECFHEPNLYQWALARAFLVFGQWTGERPGQPAHDT